MRGSTISCLALLLLAAAAADAAPVTDPLPLMNGGASNGFTLSATSVRMGRSGACLAYGPNPKSGSVQPVGFKPCAPGALLFVYDKGTQALQVRSDTSSSLTGACLTDFGSFGSTKNTPGQPVVTICSRPPTGSSQQWIMVRKSGSGMASTAYLRSKSGLCLAYDEAKSLVVGVKCGTATELEFSIAGL